MAVLPAIEQNAIPTPHFSETLKCNTINVKNKQKKTT